MDIVNKDILRRWLNGHCTEEELTLIKNYLLEQGAEAFTQELEKDWENAQGIMDTGATERLLNNIHSAIQPQPLPQRNVPVLKLYNWKRITVAAAILAIVLTGGWHWFSQAGNTGTYAAKKQWHTIENKQHHKINIHLPDHSGVWLAVGATLQYATNFGQSDRHVRLVGEAFFEVTKDSLHPFMVQAGKVNTCVLGTRFNIEAYQTENVTRVSLVEGKVTATYTDAGNRDITSTLLPGNRLCYNRTSATGKVETVSLNEEAFTGTSIVLQDIPLTIALRRIGMHYGKNIRWQGNINDGQQFSAIVPGNDVVAALNNLAFVYRLQFRIEQDTIRVFKD